MGRIAKLDPVPSGSVLISARDAARTLGATLESLRSQSRPDWEAIVVSAGSHDATIDVARSFNDTRIRATELGPCPVGRARNIAAGVAKADILCVLDSDDQWLPTTFETQVATLARHPDAAMVFGDCTFFTAGGMTGPQLSAKVHQPVFPTLTDLLTTRPIPTSTIAIRRDIYQAAKGFSEAVESCEDYDLWFRLIVAGHRILGIPEVLTRIGIRPDGLSSDLSRYRKSMDLVLRDLLRNEQLSIHERRTIEEQLEGLARAKYPDHEVALRSSS